MWIHKIIKGYYGRRMVLRRAWSRRCANTMRRRGVKELELNSAHGWVPQELSFLRDVQFLEALTIIHLPMKDISGIEWLGNLRSLSISTYCKTEIDFSAFPHLEDCFIEWRAKAKSIFLCRTLKKLYVNRYSGRDLDAFGALVNLESLTIGNGPARNIEGLAPLSQLKSLSLYNLRKLTSLRGIERLINLEELNVNGCRGIRSVQKIGGLSRLRKLSLCNMGDIDSIKPIARLKNLEEFYFYEATKIVDNDLSPLDKLENLKKLSFQNRRGYSHKCEDFAAFQE